MQASPGASIGWTSACRASSAGWSSRPRRSEHIGLQLRGLPYSRRVSEAARQPRRFKTILLIFGFISRRSRAKLALAQAGREPSDFTTACTHLSLHSPPRHSREGGNPVFPRKTWIPALRCAPAGMTAIPLEAAPIQTCVHAPAFAGMTAKQNEPLGSQH